MTRRITSHGLLASLLLALCAGACAGSASASANVSGSAAAASATASAASAATSAVTSAAPSANSSSSPDTSAATPPLVARTASQTMAAASTPSAGTESSAAPPASASSPSPAKAYASAGAPGRPDAMSGMPGAPAREGSAVGHLMQVMGALLFVIMLMLALAWFVKNHGPKSLLGRVPVKVVGGVNLGGRERVLVIEVADQWLVIGATPGQITTLATLPRQATPEDEPVPGKQFSIWLKQIMEKRNG